MPVRPLIQVTFLETKVGKTKVRGRMSRPPKAPGEVALFVPPDSLIEARLMRYGKRCRLSTSAVMEGESTTSLVIGGKFAVLDGRDMENANLVLSPKHVWEETVFKPSDAVEITVDGYSCQVPISERIDVNNLPEGATVVKGSWDHEHCAICSQCICKICGPHAAISNENVWVCKKCYTDYIRPKNIEFRF